jgi:hypothetical protein
MLLGILKCLFIAGIWLGLTAVIVRSMKEKTHGDETEDQGET